MSFNAGSWSIEISAAAKFLNMSMNALIDSSFLILLDSSSVQISAMVRFTLVLKTVRCRVLSNCVRDQICFRVSRVILPTEICLILGKCCGWHIIWCPNENCFLSSRNHNEVFRDWTIFTDYRGFCFKVLIIFQNNQSLF